MSVENAIRALMERDESLTTPGFCREAATKIQEIVQRVDPNARISFLVYGDADTEYVHYLPIITIGDKKIAANTVPAALFPQYIGLLAEAPFIYLLDTMTEMNEVI